MGNVGSDAGGTLLAAVEKATGSKVSKRVRDVVFEIEALDHTDNGPGQEITVRCARGDQH